MKGLELSRALFRDRAEKELKARFPELFGRLAFGLVGNGSECFGFDDEISRDHDWGADFYVWLPDDLEARAAELNTWKAGLLEGCGDLPIRRPGRYGAGISAVTVGGFYRQLIGFPAGPQSAREWMSVPESHLALAVNGEVFLDNEGAFTAVRDRLARHYPRDVLLQRMSARCMLLAQTGQYNLSRCHRRGDNVAAALTLARFTEQAIWMAHLLNGRYMPYYKWAFRSLSELPALGPELCPALEELALSSSGTEEDNRRRESIAEQICRRFADELRSRGLTTTRDSFLVAHAEQLHTAIEDPFLRSLPPQIG